MNIIRFYQDLDRYLASGKALVIYGPRQVGKTTLLQDYLSVTHFKYKLDSGDDIRVQEVLGSGDLQKISNYVKGYELIAIDEAQKIKNIGQGLKIIVDHCPDIKVVVTGSASFELAGQIGEPLTGRKTTLTLFPISQKELAKQHNPHELQNALEDYLVFGSYPAVLTASDPAEKKRILNEITGSYLLKDILEMDRVKSSRILLDLLRLLAFQVGNEVSLSEIAAQLGIDYKTVARYLDLFEKAFVLYNLRGFSKNLRKEITKKSKYYFYDTGIRNAIIANHNPLPLRDDVGKLWENFMFMERLKKRAYDGVFANNYFWRTWDQKEIDLIEEREGKLYAYEFKWGDKLPKAPKGWVQTYPESQFQVIHPGNYLEFIV